MLEDNADTKKYKKTLNSHNSTIYPLDIVNIVEQILREYGDVFDVSYDPTNLSNMMKTKVFNLNSSFHFVDDVSVSIIATNHTNNNINNTYQNLY
ncbi:MAG TPA: hypothetical protein VKA95_01980 [Nitrososphaeraceae archaeon]|nr:hypothetical protein [Nitrososphaeraceae archaeon]